MLISVVFGFYKGGGVNRNNSTSRCKAKLEYNPLYSFKISNYLHQKLNKGGELSGVAIGGDQLQKHRVPIRAPQQKLAHLVTSIFCNGFVNEEI